MRILRPLAAAVLAGLALGAAPAGATAPASPAQLTVTVFLAPPDPVTLHAFAAARALTGDRAARARALQPGAARQAAVAGRLQALGLRVVRTRAWSVTAQGPAAAVDAAFGSARSVRPEQSYAQALPRLPASLGGLVVAALGGDDHRPAARPLFTGYTGPQLRTAYGVSAAPAPSQLTVATVQLSGFSSADLSTYAAGAGLPDPVRSGQFSAVTVGDGRPTVPQNGGDLEFVLDQEALLAVAPAVRQRAYVASNTLADFVDAVYAVGDDAASSTTDLHLAALSISWGLCEPGWDPAAVAAMENALAYVTAAGVSVFAASGDNGVDDCGAYGNSRAVDYPAASPYVVAVGGTTLPTAGAETGWSGSGGGSSTVFGKPGWQAGTPGYTRTLPDIAAVADPAYGFRTYARAYGGYFTVGGTSLAAPVSAGLLAAELASAGYDRGVGDLHPALYAAPASSFTDITAGNNTFGGVTGYPAGPGYDLVTGRGAPRWDALAATLLRPSLILPAWSRSPIPVRVAAPAGTTYGSAGTGAAPACTASSGTASPPASYGTATGTAAVWLQTFRGGTCTVLTASTAVDSVRPSVRAWVGLPDPRYATVSADWSASDGPGGSGVGWYGVRLSRTALVTAPVLATRTSAPGLAPFAAVQGYTYYLTLTASDRAGNTSVASTRTAVPIDDTNAFRPSAGWVRRSGSAAYGTRFLASSRGGATVTRPTYGQSYTLWLVRGPYEGRADITLDGRLVKTVDLYSPVTQWRYPVVVGSVGRVGLHTVGVRVRGDRNPAARSTEVCVDALVALS